METLRRCFLGCFLAFTACVVPSFEPLSVATETHTMSSWKDDTVMYELFVPDFTEEGTFDAIIPRLGELKTLGITTLWLMPIHPIGVEKRKGVLGSPYAIRDYYAVNPDYGTAESFKALVDAIHAEGMHILLDLVANHTAWDHPWTKEHPEWYTPGEDGGIQVPVAPDGIPTDWTDVADLNYDNPELRTEMMSVMQYWIREFDIDGYRCDVAEWVPLDFWEEAIHSVRTIKSVLMLAEGGEVELHEAGFDLTYGWPFYGTLKTVWEEAESVQELRTQVLQVQKLLSEASRRLRFTTNHDETAWDRTPPQIFGGQEGARAASLLAHTLPGVPLLYNGQETGRDVQVPFFEKTSYEWSQNPEMRTFYQAFFAFYAESAALKKGGLRMLGDDDDVMAFVREVDEEQVVVVVNVRRQSTAWTLPVMFRGNTLTDILRGGETVVAGQTLSLAPYDYRLLQVEI